MSDRLRTALEALIDSILPRLNCYLQWEYTCVSSTFTNGIVTVDAKSSDPRMPDISGLQMWPDSSGSVCTPRAGALIRVAFVNGDPSKPAVVGLDPNAGPLKVYLGLGNTQVALNGSTIQLNSSDIANIIAPNGACHILAGHTVNGVITSGSSVVSAP